MVSSSLRTAIFFYRQVITKKIQDFPSFVISLNYRQLTVKI